jgi:hypothetical protein
MKILPFLIIIFTYSNIISCEIWIEDNNRNPIADAQVYFIYDDGTYESAITKRSGHSILKPKSSDKVTALIGGPGIKGVIISNFDNSKDLTIKATPKDGGSVIFQNGSGSIDGLKGTLNPILDTSLRTYIYGRDLSINNGSVQPVKFKIDETLSIKDNEKRTTEINIAYIQHRVILLNYSQVK